MSGVLHPAGPEPAQTYWLRRVLVLLALLALILVCVGIGTASVGATRQASPPNDSAAGPDATQSGSPSPSGSPTALSSIDATPSPAATPSSADPESTDKGTDGKTTAVPPACARKDLKVALTGKQMLKLGKPAAFAISVTNNGDAACQLSLARTDFELKVTTGKKLLWSSRSCNTATFVVAAKLDLDQATRWAMTWDGRGTAIGCVVAGPALKKGTYLATATVTGAKPAELPITLRA